MMKVTFGRCSNLAVDRFGAGLRAIALVLCGLGLRWYLSREHRPPLPADIR